jgi:hypothetical protein
MARNGEQLDDRSAVLPAEQSGDPRSIWTPRRPVRRALIAAYLLTLAALATVGWIDALNGGVRESDPTRTLWAALLIVTLVQVALLNKATYGQFTLRLQDLDERQRAARDLGYRYSYRILASAVTVLLAVALQLPVDRLLGATNRLAWLAVAIVVVQLMWMLPTMIVGWIEPVRAWTDKSAPVTLRPPVTAVVTLPQAGCSSVARPSAASRRRRSRCPGRPGQALPAWREAARHRRRSRCP